MSSTAAAGALARFSLPSEPGNERLALRRVAEAVVDLGLSTDQLERLKTAVAEATMNAIEHGNGNRADVPVEIEVRQAGRQVVVEISDSGGDRAARAAAEEPDLALKLDGLQRPRGWGLFLIRNMVDDMDVASDGERHTVRLAMRVAGEAEKKGGRS
ncbi:MAG TPA: ATP-binding protein [Nocardioidaceae bacterium]|nr:ATP-binding protein [Nocardioidaceae bacterium]